MTITADDKCYICGESLFGVDEEWLGYEFWGYRMCNSCFKNVTGEITFEENIQKSIERLKLVGGYEGILRNLELSGKRNWPFIFELLFAGNCSAAPLIMSLRGAFPSDEAIPD